MTTVKRNDCIENHEPPANVPAKKKIGTIAGFSAFSIFCQGDYGEDESILDQIASWNANYQENEFSPRQQEALEIWDWLEATHDIDDNECPVCGYPHYNMAQFQIERNDKLSDLRYLDEEIDAEWCDLSDMCRAIVSDTAYNTFLTAQS